MAIIPIENSTNGSVVLACDSLRDYIHNSPENNQGVTVINEIFVPIQHCLISFAPDVSHVSKLYTHPQAWGQVTNFLTTELPVSNGIPRIDADSTSAAVAIVAKELQSKLESNGRTSDDDDGKESYSNDPKNILGNDQKYSAAIASSAAAKVHNVPILVPNISDVTTNTTRFLVFVRPDFPIGELEYLSQKYMACGYETAHKTDIKTVNTKTVTNTTTNSTKTSPPGSISADFVTLVSVTVSHTEPGSLCTCLQAFSKRNINLTSISSRPAYNPAFDRLKKKNDDKPSNLHNWEYVFFIEFYGNLYLDKAVQQVLDEIKQNCTRMTVFGSFPRASDYLH